MHKLFTASYLRTLQKLNTAELSPATAQELLTKAGIPPSNEDLLFKLPRDEFKHALNVPCPINSLTEEGADAVIASSKLLRHHLGYVESKICLKCPLAGECKSAKLPWDGQNKDNTMKDLLVFFNGMSKLQKPELIYYRQWAAAYKLQENVAAAFEDLVNRSEEIKEYNQLRIQAVEDFKKKNEAKAERGENPQSKDNQNAGQTIVKTDQKETPKESVSSKMKPIKKNQKLEEVMGRDFSFDEEQEFEKPVKAAKPSFKEREPRELPISKERGYIKIEKPQKTYPPKNYPPPRQDNKFRNDKFQRNDRSDRNDKFERNGYQDGKKGMKPKQNDKFRNEEEDEEEFIQRQNLAKKERYDSNKKPNKSKGYEGNDEAPKRNFQKKSQENWKRNDGFEKEERPKGNQFVNKWQDQRQQEVKPRYKAPQQEAEFREPSFSKPTPKQVHIPTPAPEPVDEAPRVGRNIRRRRTISAPTEE